MTCNEDDAEYSDARESLIRGYHERAEQMVALAAEFEAVSREANDELGNRPE